MFDSDAAMPRRCQTQIFDYSEKTREMALSETS